MQNLLSPDSDEFKNLIYTSAHLRGSGRFTEAIQLVEDKLGELHPDCRENAYLEIIYAAQEGQLPDTAKRYATLLAAIDPDMPTVKKILESSP
jgi:hypothetical protein